MRSFGPRIIIALVIAAISAATYFSSSSTNEITGEVQRVSISQEQEVALGLQAMPEMGAQFGGEVQNSEISNYVEQVGQKVARQAGSAATPYKFDFHVLRDPQTINAFALPGGQVSITMGLLTKLKNEAELAGVLGHEIGHVMARHGAEHLAKQQLTQGLVGAVGVATYDPQNPSASTAAIAAAVGQLVSMRYGRNDELESDALGVKFMKQAGYDPTGMISLMNVLAQGGGGGRQPEFFSTHPNPDNRMARLEELIRTNGGAGGDLGAERFRRVVR
ncbi:MAG: M48 family metallopeptidase [Gemmatimonadaceae bacterium]